MPDIFTVVGTHLMRTSKQAEWVWTVCNNGATEEPDTAEKVRN